MASSYDVYVSYSRADSDWTERLVEDLRRAGLRVWYASPEIDTDETAVAASKTALAQSNAGIVILSANSADRRWINRDLEAMQRRARAEGFRTVVVLLDDVRLSDVIAQHELVDFRQAEGPTYERCLQQLLGRLRWSRPASNLPSPPPGPAIRTDELEQVLLFLRQGRPGRRLAAILGPPGTGKSALALYAAHQLRDRYPDGQLAANLGGLSGTHEVLGRFLIALGLSRSEIPRESAERLELYRALTADRRMLLILDEPERLGIAQDLFPSGSDWGVLLTSVSISTDLQELAPLTESITLKLATLREQAALNLLRLEAGTERVDADLEGVKWALQLVGESPLLVILLARQLRDYPQTSARELLEKLLTSEDTPVGSQLRASLTHIYETMDFQDQRLFRLLAVLLDPEFEIGLAAAIAGWRHEEADASIRRLVAAQLIEAVDESRYRIRDVVRTLAQEQLDNEDDVEQEAAQQRALRWLAVHGEYQPEPRIYRDYWTPNDSLGYAQYADAIASFIWHQETRPPLTIGIKAPWGAGKTSLMRMVQERLDPPIDRDNWAPIPLRLTPDSRQTLLDLSPEIPTAARWSRHTRDDRDAKSRVTMWELLRGIWQSPRASHDDPALAVIPPQAVRLRDPERDWRPTVWFNPWMYQSGEQVWAGLAHEIISQISGRLEPGDRERFWLELNLGRIDHQAVRRKVYRALMERLLPLVIGVVIGAILLTGMLVVTWLAPVTKQVLQPLSAMLLSLGATGTIAAAIRRGRRFFQEEAAGQFQSLVGEPNLAGGSKRLVTEEAIGAVDNLIRDPGYEARLGFLYLVQTDMKRVLNLVASERRPLVVFVDDLDRCSRGVPEVDGGGDQRVWPTCEGLRCAVACSSSSARCRWSGRSSTWRWAASLS